MSTKKIDARGRSCPEPVLMLKKAITDAPQEIEILSDSNTSVQNIIRFAESHGYSVQVTPQNEEFILKVTLCNI